MTRQVMAFDDAVSVARLWGATGGRREVELGALEPLLWRDGRRGPADLVEGLASLGFRVTMTTNASRLADLASELQAAGLSLLRISWHTTDPDRYRQISGHGDYTTFMRGITAAAEAGLRISFNRVLFRDSVHDVPEQIRFIREYGLRLKLYDLLWTPEIADEYSQLYQDWRSVVREHVMPLTERIERLPGAPGRARLRFHLVGGGDVEIKLSSEADRSRMPCNHCDHQVVCKEGFGDYVRVEPELRVYFCYLRRDIGFDLRPLLGAVDAEVHLRELLYSCIGADIEDLLQMTPLRFITVPFCNFNCFVPGTTKSWCHKSTGDFAFPGRPKPAVRGQAEDSFASSGISPEGPMETRR